MSIEKKDYFIVEDGVICTGRHLIIDLYDAKNLTNLNNIKEILVKCVKVAEATLLNIDLHHFSENDGVSGVAVLAESHISIHTWPEYNYAALDVFMCGDTKPELCIEVLKEEFETLNINVQKILRGQNIKGRDFMNGDIT